MVSPMRSNVESNSPEDLNAGNQGDRTTDIDRHVFYTRLAEIEAGDDVLGGCSETTLDRSLSGKIGSGPL